MVADARVEERHPPEADQRERVAVERRVRDARDDVVGQREQHRRQPEPEQVVRVPPVEDRVREAVGQRSRRRAPDVPGSPDHVSDRVVDGKPDRAGDEEPDGDVDRPDRPDRDRREDVDDVRAPDDEQRDVERPDELAVLAPLAVPGEQADHAEQEHDVPGPGAPDAEPLAPHPARADEARQHVEERAEVHHRQPREDHAVHVRGADAAEREPRDAAEGLRRHELGREHEAEEVDDGQPDDRREEPVSRGAVGERRRAVAARSVSGAGASRPALGDPCARPSPADRYARPDMPCRVK